MYRPCQTFYSNPILVKGARGRAPCVTLIRYMLRRRRFFRRGRRAYGRRRGYRRRYRGYRRSNRPRTRTGRIWKYLRANKPETYVTPLEYGETQGHFDSTTGTYTVSTFTPYWNVIPVTSLNAQVGGPNALFDFANRRRGNKLNSCVLSLRYNVSIQQSYATGNKVTFFCRFIVVQQKGVQTSVGNNLQPPPINFLLKTAAWNTYSAYTVSASGQLTPAPTTVTLTGSTICQAHFNEGIWKDYRILQDTVHYLDGIRSGFAKRKVRIPISPLVWRTIGAANQIDSALNPNALNLFPENPVYMYVISGIVEDVLTATLAMSTSIQHQLIYRDV